MICLSLSIASIGRAMQRQADNRHYLIAQVSVTLISRWALKSPNVYAMRREWVS